MMKALQLTLKITTAQVVETSVTNNSLTEDYSHPEDHYSVDKQLILLGSNSLHSSHLVSCLEHTTFEDISFLGNVAEYMKILRVMGNIEDPGNT